MTVVVTGRLSDVAKKKNAEGKLLLSLMIAGEDVFMSTLLTDRELFHG